MNRHYNLGGLELPGDYLGRELQVNTHQGALNKLADHFADQAKNVRELADLANQGKIKIAYAGENRIVFKGEARTLYLLDNRGVLLAEEEQDLEDRVG